MSTDKWEPWPDHGSCEGRHRLEQSTGPGWEQIA